ncbi:MAG: YicC/YloC family endoribonuclease [Sphaerochaetaceae bacterium]|nr:YicC/YloC family endoribonuclease [Sphaerochaetaceae bacterium]
MKSMTGYGTHEIQNEQFQLAVEVKSYNNRFLDIVHNIPYYLSPFEIEIDEQVKKVASRGHVEVSIRVKQLSSDMQVMVDDQAVLRYKTAFDEIAKVIGGKNLPYDMSDFIQAEGVLTSLRQNDSEIYRRPLFEALGRALEQLCSSKTREGEATRGDLRRMADRLSAGLDVVKNHADELETMVKNNLRSRFEEMLGAQGYDEGRFLQEVAVMLVKYSVNEELVRLSTHLVEFDKLLKLDEPVGKRMDFLCQEMNREINTIGSKSQMVEINLQVVAMKDSLENIREQIRNIE